MICYNTRTQQFHKLQANNVSNIYYYNDTLWIAGYNKLEFQIEGDSTIRLLTTFKEHTRASSPICCTDDGYIYIGMNKGLLRIDRRQPERRQSLLTNVKVQSLYQDSQKNLWICTAQQGVYRLASDGSIPTSASTSAMQLFLPNFVLLIAKLI